MTNYDVVKKLIGKIKPIGESNEDEVRYDNLKAMCTVVEHLLYDIDEIASLYKDEHRASVKKMGEYANNFISEMVKEFSPK